MLTKHLVQSETNSQVVPQKERLFEKLNMATVKDVIAPGDKDSVHGNESSSLVAELDEVELSTDRRIL